MQLICFRCHHTLEFSSDRPSFCSYCGSALTDTQPAASEAATLAPEPKAPDCEQAPEVVGGYRLLRVLGGGGMGTVYEAEDAASGRRVALKLISTGYAGSPDAVQRFRQEGRLASAISHPRCVFVLAADEEAGRPYIVMELMPGSTLEDRVADQAPLPPEKALAAILDVIEGLEEAHRHGVIHRDVKPSNCFLDADGRVKVGDFGLSKSLAGNARLTRTGSFLGTPLYASPETILDFKHDSLTVH
jgi:serine/threonine protein kinase